MTILSLDDYYLWRRELSDKKYPWQRELLNIEFYKYEVKRLKEVERWYQKVVSTRGYSVGSYVDEISLYVVPVELATRWKAAIARMGDYNCFGLAPLINTPNFSLIGLTDRNVKRPKDYKLIRILKAKKTYIIDQTTPSVEPAIIIEEWEYLNPDHVYVGVPFERRSVEKLISDYFVSDNHIPISLQSPIISAPYVYGGVGGVSLFSMSLQSSFARTLVNTIQLMVPPEYRTIPPPKSVLKGCKFQYHPGIKYHLAERPYYVNNLLKGLFATSYKPLDKELQRRQKFVGEYSISSVITFSYHRGGEVFEIVLDRFSKTEITIPHDLEDYYMGYIDLKGLRKEIDEDLWLQVVHARQIHPSWNDEADKALIRYARNVRESIEMFISEYFPSNSYVDYRVGIMMGSYT
ncbi:hypothetical protein DRP05_14955 [Archaeoglobales archaeon]|nr:MAG: hypothetical protein DRP05_14955 [Archaeoglobales archaeon]